MSIILLSCERKKFKMREIWKLIYFFTFFISISLSFHSTEGTNFNVVVNKLSIGEKGTFVLNNTKEYIIEIINLPNSIVKVPPRVFVKCEDCKEDHPLLVVVRQNKGVMSWELPVVIQSKNHYSVFKNIEKTLCPFDIMNSTSSFLEGSENNVVNPVTLSLSTSSDFNVTVNLVVHVVNNFVIDLKTNRTVYVTPSTPSFYLFEFPPKNVSSILLHVTSDDDTCLIVSIQNVSCPVFDLEQNVKYRGHYQTVTRQGGLTLTKENFPDGFYIMLVVSEQDNYCSSTFVDNKAERMKTVVISVSETISSEEYKVAVGVTFLAIIIFCSIMCIIYFYRFKKEKSLVPILDGDCKEDEEYEPSASASSHLPYIVTSPVTPVTLGTDTLSIKTDSSLDETDFDLVNDAELDKNIFRMKGFLYVSDLSRKNQTVLKKKSELYFWNLLTVSIFYFLPVIQLVITNQYQLNQSGEEDLCYYNFLCSHPLWLFSDFNHVFSNIGYISFGALFMFLTVMKERVYRLKSCSNKKLYRFYGIPQHFGLFYAMGTALIIEGVLSSCYHICPNHYNFQFDSSFMYVISVLCMIKIYQTRHPDINASAYATFFLLAGVILIGMYGVFSNNLIFWILFTIVHLSTCIYLSLQIYYMGRWRLEFFSLMRFFKELNSCRNCNLSFFIPMFPSRFLLLVVANACNWGLAVGSFLYDIKNFSSYLLIIFMVNLMLYTTFYILMKFICKERLPMQSIIYILLSIVTWSASLYFFFNKTISWVLTPAESKLYNQKCKLLDFYDNHDIWHFLSASAMFFSFMVLLTLDDDLCYVHRSKIVVF